MKTRHPECNRKSPSNRLRLSEQLVLYALSKRTAPLGLQRPSIPRLFLNQRLQGGNHPWRISVLMFA